MLDALLPANLALRRTAIEILGIPFCEHPDSHDCSGLFAPSVFDVLRTTSSQSAVWCRMPLWQLTEEQLQKLEKSEDYSLHSELSALGESFVHYGLYWRLDFGKFNCKHIPKLVFHLNQTLVCELLLHQHEVIEASQDKRLLCVVDLPDSVIFKAGVVYKPAQLVKFLGRDGSTNNEKMGSLQLHKLWRSNVVDAAGNETTGFPLVAFECTMNLLCGDKNSVGVELHQAWKPTPEAFEDLEVYLSEFWAAWDRSPDLDDKSEACRQKQLPALPQVIISFF